MQQVHIKFSNVEQVRQFVNSIDKIDANFDLGSGHKIVDAKSILGVIGLYRHEGPGGRADSRPQSSNGVYFPV